MIYYSSSSSSSSSILLLTILFLFCTNTLFSYPSLATRKLKSVNDDEMGMTVRESSKVEGHYVVDNKVLEDQDEGYVVIPRLELHEVQSGPNPISNSLPLVQNSSRIVGSTNP